MTTSHQTHNEGDTYFFTFHLRNPKSRLLIEHFDLLQESFRQAKKEVPFALKGIVVLPDHLHAILKLPPGDHDFSLRWRRIKQAFTLALIKRGVSLEKTRRGEHQIWQRRFCEKKLSTEQDLEEQFQYLRSNPLKHGYVTDISDWPYSSFHPFQTWKNDPQYLDLNASK